MGRALNDIEKPEEAITAYTKAISINQSAQALNNMGIALNKLGKIEEELNSYTRAIMVEPNNSEAKENLLGLQNQLLGTELLNKKIHEKYTENNFKTFEGPRHKVQKIINAFLRADFNLANKHIKNYFNSDAKLVSNLDKETRVFCTTYAFFLFKLIEDRAGLMSHLPSDKVIYNLGESHCLSFAHRKIKIGGFDHIIHPKITFGAKAFHFSNKKESAFTAITRANFNSLPNGSKVFLSFGEIDCRPNEGFISASKKHKKPIEDLVYDTVSGYVDWFAEQNQSKNHNLFFFNVPASIYSEKFTAQVNEKVASTIKLFNSLLQRTVLYHNFNILDVYKFTVGQDGCSNGEFHIDGRHLSSNAISEIEEQISNFV